MRTSSDGPTSSWPRRKRPDECSRDFRADRLGANKTNSRAETMRLTITVRHDPADDDLLLDLEPETPIAQLATALGYGVDDLWVGDERVGGAGPVGGSAIRTGSVVTLAGPVIPRPETVWPWQLLVVGG